MKDTLEILIIEILGKKSKCVSSC